MPVVKQVIPAALDELLYAAVSPLEGVPGVVAMVADAHSILYTGAAGLRQSANPQPIREDTVFRLFSMTKPITSVAAMQLVEQGALHLEDPAENHLPSLAQVRVLTEAGELRKPKRPITIRHLLTHTSGFAYPYWCRRFREYTRNPNPETAPKYLLLCDPAEQWLYGTSTGILGEVVEAVSGSPLDVYLKRHILDPLGLRDTTFDLAPEQTDRLASLHRRQPDNTLQEQPPDPTGPDTTNDGGHGLFGTAGDYIAFMQMILRKGRTGASRVLQPETLAEMTRNQIGSFQAGRFSTASPAISKDVDFHPGSCDKFGFGFLINDVPYANGRSRHSLAWSGAANTYFWIDPEQDLCAVLMMQLLPFFDHAAVALYRSFEKLVYASDEIRRR